MPKVVHCDDALEALRLEDEGAGAGDIQDVVAHAMELDVLAAQLGIQRAQFLIGRLQLFLRGFELFVRALQLLIR